VKCHLLSAALIVVAIILEMAGYGRAGTDSGATLFVAGVACEFWFWSRTGLARKAMRRKHSGT
jgi:hypothetical protein